MSTAEKFVDIVFDGPPGPVAGRFVEAVTRRGWDKPEVELQINHGPRPFWWTLKPTGSFKPDAPKHYYGYADSLDEAYEKLHDAAARVPARWSADDVAATLGLPIYDPSDFDEAPAPAATEAA